MVTLASEMETTTQISTKMTTQNTSTSEENIIESISQLTPVVNVTSTTQSSNFNTTNTPIKQDKDDENKKKKPSRTPFQRPFWMNLSRRPFRTSGLRKPKSDSIVFPEESLLIKGLRKPYIYIFPDFQLNDAGPYKGVYWKQFFHSKE